MSKSEPFHPGDWEQRLFRNTYTYRGERRAVRGWFVKLQWRGRRRTLRLGSERRADAAVEARELYTKLRREGWGAVVAEGSPARRGSVRTGQMPVLVEVGLRKYVSELNAASGQELFAALPASGGIRHVALGTEDWNEARLRAGELLRELQDQGWARLQLAHSWEATVAVFWYSNPMTCTYTTLLTFPARGGAPPRSPVPGSGSGWRVLVVEPDGGVRRAMVDWLGRSAGLQRVDAFAASADVPASEAWDVVLANQKERPADLRAMTRSWQGSGPRVLTHGVFADSDAIFASVSGVSRGYLLKRLAPSALLDPLVQAFPEGPPRQEGDVDRQVRRYFQAIFDPGSAAPVAGTPELTLREHEILERLSRGLSDKEVGRDLGISVWTVHSHLKRIFAKYGVRTRTEAVVRHLQK